MVVPGECLRLPDVSPGVGCLATTIEAVRPAAYPRPIAVLGHDLKTFVPQGGALIPHFVSLDDDDIVMWEVMDRPGSAIAN